MGETRALTAREHRPAVVRRAVIVVMDGMGAGALGDAAAYGDEGSDTLGNLARAVGGLNLPNLAALGLGRVHDVQGVPPLALRGAAGLLAERSPGKDTLTGHWELAGLVTDSPIPTYPTGFPPPMLAPFESALGGPVLGNRAASGTEIIVELGQEHLRTGRPIVYTSADSVFQVAAHEDVIPLNRLYRLCEIARELYGKPPYLVGRVIARPFTGRPGAFRRTSDRHDYSLPPPGPTLLDDLAAAGFPVLAVGKVKDIFAGRGVTEHRPAAGNREIIEATIAAARSLERGLIFANLVDFDMLFGHRNDVKGLARALEDWDHELPRVREAVLEHREGGLLIVTADHGCDPTTASTDHSREYVPVLADVAGAGPSGTVSSGLGDPHPFRAGADLGRRESFADVAATVAELMGLHEYRGQGRSFAARWRGQSD